MSFHINFTIIIPVYKNEPNIPDLLDRLSDISYELNNCLEAVFVVDGSPDKSYQILKENIAKYTFPSELVLLSRNFGPTAAVRMGMSIAHGNYISVMAADLQEPAELIIDFFRTLENGDADIVLGKRVERQDPIKSRLFSSVFWSFYKKFVQPDMPEGGIDVFGCNEVVKKNLLNLNESNTSMPGQLIWVGFRRKEISYTRQARKIGKSSWSFQRKFRYMMDSIFSFTDLPIFVITFLGGAGLFSSILLSFGVLISHYLGKISVPGYTPIILSLMFSLSLILISLGIIGNYVWRSYENTKNRPIFLPMQRESFNYPPIKY